MADITTTIRLAKAFGAIVRESFSRRDFRQILDRNRRETNPGVCHTHDFCDANMLMEAAFIETMGREPLLPCDSDGTAETEARQEAECVLWSDAWAIAGAAEFFS